MEMVLVSYNEQGVRRFPQMKAKVLRFVDNARASLTDAILVAIESFAQGMQANQIFLC